jgi:hypothetical protein
VGTHATSTQFSPGSSLRSTVTTETRTRPTWAAKYLHFAFWTAQEFRNLLCGFPPEPSKDAPWPDDKPLPSPEEQNEQFTRDELRRIAADRHVRDAVDLGDLDVLETPDLRILEKIKDALTLDEITALKRAIVHEGSCSQTYRVRTADAVRWTASRRDLFPQFPFTIEDHRRETSIQPSGMASGELKEKRRQLLRRAIADSGSKTQTAFGRKHKFSPDVLRSVISGDTRRSDVTKWTALLLEILHIPEADWNSL